MTVKSTLISVVALASAMNLALPAQAQDAPAQPLPPAPPATEAPAADAGTAVDAGASAETPAAPAPAGGTAAPADAAAGPTEAGTTVQNNVDVDVTVEQQTEIRSAITEVNVAPVANIDIDINVGVVVPQTIKLQPLPARVVAVVPQFDGYLFFLLPDGRIVIVAPSSLEIVYIFAA